MPTIPTRIPSPIELRHQQLQRRKYYQHLAKQKAADARRKAVNGL